MWIKGSEIREGTRIVLPPFEDQPRQRAVALARPKNGCVMVEVVWMDRLDDDADGLSEVPVSAKSAFEIWEE